MLKCSKFFRTKPGVGIKDIGKTIEEAFCEAAIAMFSVMADLEDAKAVGEVKVKIEAESLEELFTSWLNGLLSKAHLRKQFSMSLR
ncbi:MAG: archease [Candidatus Diapherotrites archaeon]